MRIACALALFVSFLLSGPSLLAKNRPWTEIRSPHFRLITNGDVDESKHVLQHFELMRSAFQIAFPQFKLDSPAPLLILAAKDESTTRDLLPQFWPHPGPNLGGLYHHGWEREHALVRLDVVAHDPETYHSIYHEYVHSLLHINFHWLPPWLDEGLAEFYGYTEFRMDKMYIGSPPNMGMARFLVTEIPIPLDKFVTSPVMTSNPEQSQLAYAQAWALTHFLWFGEGMDSGQKLGRLLQALQNGTNSKKAFEETIGSFPDVEKSYSKYIHQSRFMAMGFPVPQQLDPKSFQVREMSLGETEAELAAWYIQFHRWDKMREFTDAALKDSPNLSLAHEDDGFLLFNEGHDADALKEFTTAAQLDNKNYIALFAKTMISAAAQSNAETDHQTYDGLNQVVELKPDFAPAYVELAKQEIHAGQLSTALAVCRRAEQLEPFRSGYHVLCGEIMLLLQHPSDAAAEASYVAQRWGGSDRDEALELWNRIPAEDRHADLPSLPPAPDQLQVAEGTVKSVVCDGSA
ncbi:MAG TPA: hypothetical protein VN684_00150, partial [Terriglobales bacterium]|nr:hypothetical protein [Terriglobales bacterium]